MPFSDSIKQPLSQPLHAECPILPWMDDRSCRLKHQDVQELMSQSKERFIEILLAETGAEIGEITAALERDARGAAARLIYRMALVIARLDVLQQNRYILAGADAFEKLTLMRKQADSLLEQHWKNRDPFKAATDKWTELRGWMRLIEDIEVQVTARRQALTKHSGRIPDKAAIEQVREALETLVTGLPPQILTILDRMPADAISDGRPLPVLADFAVLQQLVHQPGHDIVGRFEELHALVTLPGCMTEHPLMVSAQETLAQARGLLELHGRHSRTLQQAHIEFHSGNIDKARHLLSSLKNITFADLEYDSIRKSVSRAARLMNQLKTEKRSEAAEHARNLLNRYPGIHMDSQIYQEATLMIERGGRGRIIRYACAALVLLACGVGFGIHLKKKADLRDMTQKTKHSQPASDPGQAHPPLEVSTTIGEQDDPND